jgi:hypothetical protein
VACIFNQANHNSAQDQNIIVADLQYVGVLKEIVMANYLGVRLVLFKWSWILANVRGNTRTIQQDENGFWTMNFQR